MALHTARLWTRAQIEGTFELDTARIWLERSKSAPVSITYFLSENDPEAIVDFTAVLELVSSHLNYTVTLDISIDPDDLPQTIETLNKPALNLRVFKLHPLVEEDNDDDDENVAKDLFEEKRSPESSAITTLYAPGLPWN